MSNADIRGRFIWHELMTTDTDAAAAFYSKVVPWKTQDSGMPSYTLWMAGKTRVGGLTGLPADGAEGTPPHWIVYIATPDVDATVAQAQSLGGKVLKGATDIPNMGRYAVLMDPQGATFAVYTPPGPPPEGADAAAGGPGEFNWHELATTDYEAALSFYTELFGWEKGPAHDMGGMGIYQLINLSGAQAGGIYNLQGASTPPHWLSYVRVLDCAKAATAAKSAGARILNGPMEVPGGSWITMMEDPQGGAFAVVEPPKTEVKKPAAKAPKKSADKPKAAAQEDAAPRAESPAAKPAAAEPVKAKAKAAAKKAPRKAAAKKAAAKGGAAKKAAGKKVAKKAAGKAPAKKKAAAKRPGAKRVAAKGTSAKQGAKKPAKKSGKGAAKGKRR